MPRYRLIFPTDPGAALEDAPTAEIESEVVYEAGALLTYGGRRWLVSQASLEQPDNGETADLMVWPAD